jgi:hypothetical protein
MAKIAMTKLGLNKNTSVKVIEFNNQKIEIKQYLPIENKLDLISNILNFSVDLNNFYNPCRIEIFQTIYIIMNYTNINFTDKQKEDVFKLYDLLKGSGLAKMVFEAIPEDELTYIYEGVLETISSIYEYKNSAAGILHSLS